MSGIALERRTRAETRSEDALAFAPAHRRMSALAAFGIGLAITASGGCRDQGGQAGYTCQAGETYQEGLCVAAAPGAAGAVDAGVPTRPAAARDAGRSDNPGPGAEQGGASTVDAGAPHPSAHDAGMSGSSNPDTMGGSGGSAGGNETPPPPDTGALDPNAPGVWHDPNTGLNWENPPQYRGVQRPNFASARSYCEDLNLGGARGWRVPTLDELRTLVRGISTVMPGGACPTSESCANSNDCNRSIDACLGCSGEGANAIQPGDCALTEADLTAGRCYWDDALEGDCTAYWSATTNTAIASAGRAMYYLRFENGIIRSLYGPLGNFGIRCVH